MATLRFIFGDQLNRDISALCDINPKVDIVLMVEVYEESTYVRHHKQKIVLVLSAMRHFAESLRNEGISVDYVHLDEEGNTGGLTSELRRALVRHSVSGIIITSPSEWRVREMVKDWKHTLTIPVEVRDDDRFLCSTSEFSSWVKERKNLRMEYFYRFMRRKTGWLMDDDKPAGGKWNYDAQNRKNIPNNVTIPSRMQLQHDNITREVISTVKQHFAHHFGDLDAFNWAVSREDALQALSSFMRQCLPQFGDYQDAMRTEEHFLFHAVLSPYLNIGLLSPREVCVAAIDAYKKTQVPLNAVEGFVRQILGWREFIRGVYWHSMPHYAKTNYLDAHRPLPPFYWTGETRMNCLKRVINATHRNAYAHHIQRLMITGNFALLAGIKPAEVEMWYLIVYADAFEWVELPNTHGMALYADGGILASKPYAASGAYINRMSDYCKNCLYNVKIRMGKNACPFNYLYWNFLLVNESNLKSNPRMGLSYKNLSRIDQNQKEQIQNQSRTFLTQLGNAY